MVTADPRGCKRRADRVLYGSDHPFNPMDWEIQKIVKHAQRHLKLKIEDLRNIMGGNIKRLLKMD